MAKFRASLVQIAPAIIIYLTTQYKKVRKALYMHYTMFNGVRCLWQLFSGGQNQIWESSIVWAVLRHNVPSSKWPVAIRHMRPMQLHFFLQSIHAFWLSSSLLMLFFFTRHQWLNSDVLYTVGTGKKLIHLTDCFLPVVIDARVLFLYLSLQFTSWCSWLLICYLSILFSLLSFNFLFWISLLTVYSISCCSLVSLLMFLFTL